MKKDNGFTLVELIVIIIIVGVLSGGVVIGLSRYNKLNAAAGIDTLHVALDSARSETMSSSKSNVYAEFSKGAKDYEIVVTNGTDVLSRTSSVSSKFDFCVKIGDYESPAIKSIKFYFKKGDGSLKQLVVEFADGSGLPDTVDVSNKIEIFSPDTTKRLILSPLTGRGLVQ